MSNLWKVNERTPEEVLAAERRWRRFWLVVAVVGLALLVALLLPV